MTAPLPLFAKGSVVTVGSFDGVHLGHQALVSEVCRRASRTGAAAVMVTFEPHPGSVLVPDGTPSRLTLPHERLEVVADLGLDRLVVLRFDHELAALPADGFVRDILLARCGMTQLVVGADHGFGRGRSADSRNLPALGERLGFAVTVVDPVADGSGQPVSSSRIRAALAEGNLAQAAAWLGRPYRLSARVVPGAGRGKTIGVPTINLEGPPPDKALPPDGVYAALVEWGGGRVGAMLNQGPRPTVGDARRSLEAHLFGIEQNLYGRMVRIEWVEQLRQIQKFPSLDALRAQLALDREAAHKVLARFP